MVKKSISLVAGYLLVVIDNVLPIVVILAKRSEKTVSQGNAWPIMDSSGYHLEVL